MYKRLKLSGLSVALLAAAFSFTSCEKEVVQNDSDNSVENAESEVQIKSSEESQYPEMGEMTYFESYEDFKDVANERLIEAGSLANETGTVHSFPTMKDGNGYGIGAIQDLGSNFEPNGGSAFVPIFSGLSAQYENWFAFDPDPCAWLNAFTGGLYNYEEGDC